MLFSNDILIPFIVSLYQWLSTLVSGEVSGFTSLHVSLIRSTKKLMIWIRCVK